MNAGKLKQRLCAYFNPLPANKLGAQRAVLARVTGIMNSKALLKQLQAAGWQIVRVRGSHNQLKHPDYENLITVPHPQKDLPKGLVNAIKKQARLEA